MNFCALKNIAHCTDLIEINRYSPALLERPDSSLSYRKCEPFIVNLSLRKQGDALFEPKPSQGRQPCRTRPG
jgi:hypothetical protein